MHEFSPLLKKVVVFSKAFFLGPEQVIFFSKVHSHFKSNGMLLVDPEHGADSRKKRKRKTKKEREEERIARKQETEEKKRDPNVRTINWNYS